MNQTTNTKVGQAGNSLKLKARSIKRRSISRFQLLIIYMNFMKKANKKGRPARNASPARSRHSVSSESSDAGRGEIKYGNPRARRAEQSSYDGYPTSIDYKKIMRKVGG